MKSKYIQILAATLLLFTFTVQGKAQDNADYITISGEVRDADTKKKLESVSVSVENTSISTVTNADGTFSIKVKKSLDAKTLAFMHLGYNSQRLAIGSKDMVGVRVLLTPNVYSIQEITVGSDALKIVATAISRIGENYSNKANILTGFYRETIKKRNSYINISEAITYTYKSPYSKEYYGDRAQIYKGRQLLSPKLSDTLMVKLQGGPVSAIFLDAVKSWDILTDPESMPHYKFLMDGSTTIDGRAHYIIKFRPRVIVAYALLYGKMYIDEETYTISRIEAELSMDDEAKATGAMLRKKPFGLRFKPEGLSYQVNYKRQGEISYLSYVRSELRFKCDWKRKLFGSNYLIVSEMVTTDVQDQNVAKIPAKLAFNENHSLSDKVTSFYDENFWEDYNIIEPTESLETAVNKLRKKLE